MNVERLLMVKEAILKHPDETNMMLLHDRRQHCHCIFGWAQVLFSPRFLDRFWRGRYVKRPDSEAEIFSFLGMTYAEGRRLYYADRWPGDLFVRYIQSQTKAEEAQVMAEAIDRFIADPGFMSETKIA